MAVIAGLALSAGVSFAQTRAAAAISATCRGILCADGNIVGFEVDLVKEVASRLGRDVVIQNILFQQYAEPVTFSHRLFFFFLKKHDR